MTEVQVLNGRKIPLETRLETILGRLNELEPGESLVLITPHSPEKLLNKLIEEFPLRYDFSPRERGPEVWRYEIAVRADQGPRTISGYLGWDHDRLDGMLALAFERAEAGIWDDARTLVEDFQHGLFRHIEIEEEILFKEFEARTGMVDEGPTAVMREEHIDIKAAVESMLDAAGNQDLDAMNRGKASLLAVLTDHNMKEEQILYPGTDGMLTVPLLNDLVVRLLLG